MKKNEETTPSVEVKINLEKDVATLLSEELRRCGYTVPDMKPMELFITYFGARKRMVKKRKRKVLLANGFTCPANLQYGFDLLKTKIENGEDLRPHLSRKLKDLDEEDLLLFDWNIKHFHLGETIDADGFIQRTRDLLFAMVDEDNVYCIKIAPHGG